MRTSTTARTFRLAPGRTGTPRVWSITAASWTGLYVASKVHFALEGRLGVTGGPTVAASEYLEYGPGEVAAAQWAQAGLGVLAMLVLLAPLIPRVRAVNRWVLLVPMVVLGLIAAAGAIGMLGRAALTESGGAWFGGYCLVWALLIAGAAIDPV